MPVQYSDETKETKPYNVNKVSMGIGKKSDFTRNKETAASPGPETYEQHTINSISYKSAKI